jgi:hypothetical protein
MELSWEQRIAIHFKNLHVKGVMLYWADGGNFSLSHKPNVNFPSPQTNPFYCHFVEGHKNQNQLALDVTIEKKNLGTGRLGCII